MPSKEILMARTHDVSCGNFHIKDLAQFGDYLEKAANAAFPKGLSRYKEVHVLLLSWEDDNLGVIIEVLELQEVFRQVYLYDVKEWRIPSNHSYKALRKQITKFLDEFEDKDSLLIVYYGGHGSMNDDRQCIWSCTDGLESSTVQWSGLQNMLEHAESDVLILLDCCAAASSISETGSGVTEVIAACGFETWAPGVGEHSFTRSLIDELRYWSRGHALSVAMLHNKVLSRIKYWKPRFGVTGEHEHRKTPIYIVLSNEGKQRSIALTPLQFQGSISNSSLSSIEAQSITHESSSISSESSIDQVWPDQEFNHPKVLLSLSLEENQWLHADKWIEWIQSVPALVKYAEVDGIYKSGSTLILLSVPVAVWDLLPKYPAIAFIGFIDSSDLFRGKPSSLASSHASIKAEAEAPGYTTTIPRNPLLATTAIDKKDNWLPNQDRPNTVSKKDRDGARVSLKTTVEGIHRHPGGEYRKVGALFLTWKDDDLQCRETEIDKLRQLFEEGFKFKTEYFEIPSDRWETALHKRVADFYYEYDSPEDLAILYYGGHAYEGKESRHFKLAMKFENYRNGDPNTVWDYIETIPKLSRCHQLVILDFSYSAKAFRRRQIRNRKNELLTSAAHNVRSPSPNSPQSFTRSVNDAMTRLLKDNPKGFPTSRLYNELYHTVPLDKPYKPLHFDQSQLNLGNIWLRPQVALNTPKSREEDKYLKLTLRLNADPDLMVMNELAYHLQCLPHVDQIRFEDLYSPNEQLVAFMRSTLQAQKLRPLVRKIHARRQLRRQAGINADTVAKLFNSLLKLPLDRSTGPTCDWSSAELVYNHSGPQRSGDQKSGDEKKDSVIWQPSLDVLLTSREHGVDPSGSETMVSSFIPPTAHVAKKEEGKSGVPTRSGKGKRQRSPNDSKDPPPAKSPRLLHNQNI